MPFEESDYNREDSNNIPEITGVNPRRLKRQNLESGKLISFALIWVGIFIVVLIGACLASSDLEALLTQYIGTILTCLYLSVIILVIYLLDKVRLYLENFGVSKNMRKNILCFQLGVAAITACLIMSRIEWEDDTMMMMWTSFYVLPYLVTSISLILMGKCILNTAENDFVGGVKPLGMLMVFGITFPPVWLFVPFITYNMFSKAVKYARIYGFDDQEEAEHTPYRR